MFILFNISIKMWVSYWYLCSKILRTPSSSAYVCIFLDNCWEFTLTATEPVISSVGYVVLSHSVIHTSAQTKWRSPAWMQTHIVRYTHSHRRWDIHTFCNAHTFLPAERKKDRSWERWRGKRVEKNCFYLFSARRGCDWIAVRGPPLSGSTRLRVTACVCGVKSVCWTGSTRIIVHVQLNVCKDVC